MRIYFRGVKLFFSKFKFPCSELSILGQVNENQFRQVYTPCNDLEKSNDLVNEMNITIGMGKI